MVGEDRNTKTVNEKARQTTQGESHYNDTQILET